MHILVWIIVTETTLLKACEDTPQLNARLPIKVMGRSMYLVGMILPVVFSHAWPDTGGAQVIITVRDAILVAGSNCLGLQLP
jgi:hypothetical protein